MEIIKEILFEKFIQIRKEKNEVSFVQIGAYDGKSMDDIVYIVTNEKDRGTFIEPNHHIFEELVNNKKNFKKCNFLNFAVIPNKNFYQEHFHLHKNGGGSSFVRGLMNRTTIESEDFELFDVKKITVEDLIKMYLDFTPDAYFIDCEGYDHDIVVQVLKIQKPSIIYFESWNMVDLNNIVGKKVFTTRDEIMEELKKYNYDFIFDNVHENILAYTK